MPARGWDYVVIGAGAAGCVVAGRLSQLLPEARVALIEAGRERLGVTTRVPGIAFSPPKSRKSRTAALRPMGSR